MPMGKTLRGQPLGTERSCPPVFCVYETGAARQGARAAIHRFMFSLHTTFAFRMRSSGVFEWNASFPMHCFVRNGWQ